MTSGSAGSWISLRPHHKHFQIGSDSYCLCSHRIRSRVCGGRVPSTQETIQLLRLVHDTIGLQGRGCPRPAEGVHTGHLGTNGFRVARVL